MYAYKIIVTAKGEHTLRSEAVDYGTFRTKVDAEEALKRVIENKTYYYNKEGKEL